MSTVVNKSVVSNPVVSNPVVSNAVVSNAVVDSAAGSSVGVARPTLVVRSRLHLTGRGRAVFTALAAVPIVAVALVLALNGGVAVASGPAADVSFEYVTIKSGQSLWQLAESIAPEADPRDVISDIVRLNRLPTTEVQPGQRLALPNV